MKRKDEMTRGFHGVLLFPIFALLLCVVSTGIRYWYYISTHVYIGLWCAQLNGQADECTFWGATEVWIHMCQVLMIFSILSYMTGGVILHTTRITNNTSYIKLTSIIFIFGGLCNGIAVLVFAEKYKTILHAHHLKGGNLHVGFCLSIASTVFGILSGVASYSLKTHNTSYEAI